MKSLSLVGLTWFIWPKNWWLANQCGSLKKKKKRRCAGTHELINMNHTMSHGLNKYPQLQSNKTCALPCDPPFSVYLHGSWTLGKPYELNLRCCWEHLGEQLGNLGNPMGTWWLGTRKKNQKKSLSPHPPHKEKNWTVHECMLSLPLGCMKFLFPKLLVTVARFHFYFKKFARFWGEKKVSNSHI